MSTFRLEPEHFILTTGTFNLIVKDRIRFPPKRCAFPSVQYPSRGSVRPRNLLTLSCSAKRVNPLQSQDFHLLFTAGSVDPGEKNSTRRTLGSQRSYTLPLCRFLTTGHSVFGACRSGRWSNLKRSLGGSAFRETLQEPLFPNADPGIRDQL